MRKRNMLIPAVILMATLLSAGCTAGSTQGVTETAVQAESAVEENTDENAETKALQSEEKSTLVLAYPKDLGDMNPHTMSSPMYAQDWVYDGLTALVNGKIVPLDYTLQNGDIVDIITSKTGRPSLDWLNIVGSSESKSKIRNWFKRENKAENIEKGLEALEKEAKRLNYSWKELIGDNRLQQVTKQLKAGTEEEMFAACGYGGIPVSTVLLRLIELYKKSKEAEESKHSTEQIIEKLKAQGPKTTKNGTGVLVKGEAGVMVRMAKCCSPVPGDDIIGYITRGRGVSVHRSDCTSLGHTPEDLERMIEVSWDGSSGESFHVGIDIQAYDRNGLLMEVMAVLSELKITITNINAKVQEDTKTVSINVVVDIRDISQLDFVMTKLRRIREVYTVQRSKGGA